MVGVVGYLYILQGATYVYESLFGKIQPSSQENDASPSNKDDDASEEFANLTVKQGRKGQKVEGCNALAAGRTSLENEFEEESSEDSSTGLVDATIGASSSSDPVEANDQTSTKHRALAAGRTSPENDFEEKSSDDSSTGLVNATTGASSSSDPVEANDQTSTIVAATKHQVTSQSKDQTKKTSPQKEQENDASPSNKDDDASEEFANLTVKQGRKGQKVEGCNALAAGHPSLENEFGNGSSEDNSTGLVDATTGASSSSDPVDGNSQTSTTVAAKHQVTSQSKEQTKKRSPQKEQSKTSEPSSGHAEDSVPSTSNKGQTKKQTVQRDQSPALEADAGKKGRKGKKPSCNNARKALPNTSCYEPPEKQSAHKDQGVTNEAGAGNTGGEGKDSNKSSSSDNGQNSVSTTSSKEQAKKQTAQRDHGPASEADAIGKATPTTLSKEHPKIVSGQKAQDTTCEAVVGNQEGQETKKCSSENGKIPVPNTSRKLEPQKQSAQRDQGTTNEAVLVNKPDRGKEPKNPNCDNARKTPSTVLSIEQSKQQSVQQDQGPTCEAGAGKTGGKGKQLKKITSENAKRTVSATSTRVETKKESTQKGQTETCEVVVGNDGKENEPKRPNSGNVKKTVPTTSNKEQPKKELAQDGQGSTFVADACTKEYKGREVKSDIVKKTNTSVTIEKMVEQSCVPEDSKETDNMGPSNNCQEGTKETPRGKRYSQTRPRKNLKENGKCQEYSEKTSHGKRYSQTRAPRNLKKNEKMDPSDDSQESPKKTPHGKRYSQTRAAKNLKTQARPSPTQPIQSKSSGKVQKVEDPQKKSRPTSKAKNKLKKEQPNTTALTTIAEEETSPVSASVIQQRGNTSPAVNRQTNLATYIDESATIAVNSLMAAAPVQQWPIDYLLTETSRVQKSVLVGYPQGLPSSILPHMSALRPAIIPCQVTPVMLENSNTSSAVNPQGETTPVIYVDETATPQSGITCYQNYNYSVPTTTWQMGYASPYNVYSTSAPLQQKGITPPAVEPYMETTYPVVSLEVEPTTNAEQKGFATNAKHHPAMRPPDVIQDVSYTNAPKEPAVPCSTSVPKAVASQIKQTNITNTLKEKQKSVQVTSTPKAASAPLKQQQTNINLAVEGVVQKNDQVTSLEVVPITDTLQGKTTTLTASKTPKAGATPKQRKTNTTPALKQEVQKTDQATSPKVLLTRNTPQKNATPVSTNATKAIVTIKQQPDDTCHPLAEVCTYFQAVRPKERGPLATPSSSKTAETSAADQTGSAAKTSKISRSTKRRRARARQRERQLAAEAEKRVAQAEQRAEAAGGAAAGGAAAVEEKEEADSNNHGEATSSSSSEIILNFDDDSEFVIDWQAEAARPFYNSTEDFPPRIEIPDWAEWDFSQVGNIFVGFLSWSHPGLQKDITLMAATIIYLFLNITVYWRYVLCFCYP